jgi:hypothetical protein
MAAPRLEPALEELLRALLDRDDALPFLITLVEGAEASALPLTIDLQVPAIRLVAAHMRPRAALGLAQRPEVERIEFDGQLSALRQRLA